MGTLDSSPHSFTLRPELRGVVESAMIDWPRIFANALNLKALNLAAMHLDSCHVIGALRASAVHCPHLKKLVLPFERFGVNEDKVQAVLEALYSAMKTWKTGGHGAGLLHLKVPTRNNKEKFRASTEFFHNVMAYCPDVEYLDGFKDSLSTRDTLTCKDAWLLTLEDWERLNATCTKLREFDWVVAPFGDPFFRAFGEHTKPQLKQLSFSVNMHWKWRWYFYDSSRAAGALPDEDWEEEGYCERSGFGVLATDPGAALKGCPKLDDLVVNLYHAVDHNMYIPADMGDVFDFPEEEVVNQNVFGDDFCSALSTHCPVLTRLAVKEVGEYFNRRDLKPIMTFTDHGLMALTRLPFLRSLQLRSINCTGKGVLAFLNAQSTEFRGNRTFEITVGGCPAECRLAFYDVVKELLLQLADMPDPPCARQKFVLRIGNWTYSSRESVGADWSEAFLSELETLMDRVKRSHPSLRQHVVTMGRRGNSFTRIAEFGLYTAHSSADAYWTWDDWEQERENEGISIVDRQDLLTDEDRPRSDFSGEHDSYQGYLDGDLYDGEGDSDFDSDDFEDDSDFEM